MDFQVLGPLEVRSACGLLDLGPPRQRTVLAALVVDAPRLVPLERLVARVWGEDPPASGRRALYVYLSRIRRVLADGAGEAGRCLPRLVRRSGGYLLDVDPIRIDGYRFRQLADQSRDPGLPDAERAAMLAQALRLWRGAPLSDLSGDWPDQMRQAWQRQRVDTAVRWAKAAARLGQADELIGPLMELTVEYPMVESLAATLIRALVAARRPAEALQCYEEIRRRLAEELGADPGLELRMLHKRLLAGRPYSE